MNRSNTLSMVCSSPSPLPFTLTDSFRHSFFKVRTPILTTRAWLGAGRGTQIRGASTTMSRSMCWSLAWRARTQREHHIHTQAHTKYTGILHSNVIGRQYTNIATYCTYIRKYIHKCLQIYTTYITYLHVHTYIHTYVHTLYCILYCGLLAASHSPVVRQLSSPPLSW